MVTSRGAMPRKRSVAAVSLALVSAASHLPSASTAFSASHRQGLSLRLHRPIRTLPVHIASVAHPHQAPPLASSPLRPSARIAGTALRMVLTTPEAIIEQASTQKLIDDLIDECVRTSARRPIMLQFDPSSNWIWKRWKGTIFAETWDSVIWKMAYATAVLFLCHSFPRVKEGLSGFNMLWGQLLSVTTFTLTFFVNQSYALWRKCYELSRRLQGRLHDINLTLAAHAVRKPPSNPNEPSTYTAGSRQVLELVSRYVRLFNILTYGSFTRSHRPILTPRGMRRLVERGLMTPQEREVLVDAEIPATQRHTAVLLWIIRTYVEGREAGHFLGGAGFENEILDKFHVTRAQFGAIGDELQGRMPLAYAHIVQVLVDIILWMYPWMAYSSGMSPLIAVLGTGLLTVSYQGLFDLAKQFLDPYDNESYGKGEDPLVVDTLIAETNAGSVRWLNGLEQYPVAYQKVKDGDLSDVLLPVRGYTVEEVEEMEIEKLRKEKERAERQAKEELERQRLELETKQLQSAAEAMIPALVHTTALDDGVLSQLEISAQPNPSVNKGLRPPRKTKTIKYDSCLAASEVLSYFPEFGNLVADDLLPEGISLSLESSVQPLGLRKTEANSHVSRINGDSLGTISVDQPETLERLSSNRQQNVADRLKQTGKGHEALDGLDEKRLKEQNRVSSAGIHREEIEQGTDNAAEILELQETESSDLIVNDGSLSINPLAFDDVTLEACYENHAEKMEMLETEAILNAPPAADNIEILETIDTGGSLVNVTDCIAEASSNEAYASVEGLDAATLNAGLVFDLDDETINVSDVKASLTLSVPASNETSTISIEPEAQDDDKPFVDEELELPAENVKQPEIVLTPEEELKAELLETEAILNAPPAADSIEILEKKDGLSSFNGTQIVDELAILEMDEPTDMAQSAVDKILNGSADLADIVASTKVPKEPQKENSDIRELYSPPVDLHNSE